jgi:outer membrane protein assembly factor BamA
VRCPAAALALLLYPISMSAQQALPVEELDVPGLIRAWRGEGPAPEREPGERMITAAPVIGSNPTSGFFVGAAAQVAFFRGDPATTRMSSGIVSGTISSKKQVVFNLRFDAFTEGNEWLVESDNRFQKTSQDVYGFGSATPSSAAQSADFNFVRLHETLYRQVARDFYIGGGFLFDSHTSVKPDDESNPNWQTSPYITYSEQNALPTDAQESAGFSVNAVLNRRDSDISPRRGWRAGGSYRWSFDGFLGGDSAWQQFDLDARAYVPLAADDRYRLALWGYTSLVTAGVAPYFDVPTTVMDRYGRSARGYQEGRYRGEQLVYGEAEYRGPLMRNGLLGMVAFTTMTTVSNKTAGEKLFDSVAPSAGAGLRLLLNKRSRTNLCFDFAWGKDGSTGVYLAIQDAF